jgi:hypothetical protein
MERAARERIIALVIGMVAAVAGAEGAIRWQDGNAVRSLDLFDTLPDSRIVLQADARTRLRHISGMTYIVATDARRFRIDPGAIRQPVSKPWLVAGDSQVFGMGVSGAETFAATATSLGLEVLNAGVPGYGIHDVLHQAEAVLEITQLAGVIVVVNQATHWSIARKSMAERFRVRGGRLVRIDDADSVSAAFLTTPLARLHLLLYPVQYLESKRHAAVAADNQIDLRWIRAPEALGLVTRDLTEAIADFAIRHSTLHMLVCFLPVDFASGESRAALSPFAPHLRGLGSVPWRDHTLRDQLKKGLRNGIEFTDLTPALADKPNAFLAADYHLSAMGHRQVAQHLVERLRGRNDIADGSPTLGNSNKRASRHGR